MSEWRRARKRVRRAMVYGLGVAAALPCLNTAWAQTADVSHKHQERASTQAIQSPELAEIVVTAQKRKENVQNIPTTVEVVSQSALAAAGVNSLQDLGLVSPAIQGTSGTPFSPPAIRGISSFALSIGVQTQTGVVLDGIPQPSFSTLANELIDVERVEVLPGPQFTLSGRNAAGGLINIVTRSPSSTYHALFSAEQTTDQQTRIAGFVSGPISPELAFSVSAYSDRWGGPYINAGEDGRRLGGFNQRGVRAKLRWEPNGRFRATVTGFFTSAEFTALGLLSGGPYVAIGPGAGSFFEPGVSFQQLFPLEPVGPYNRTVDSTDHSRSANQNKGLSLTLDYDLPFGTLTSITSRSSGEQPRTDLFLGFPFYGTNMYAETNTDVTYTTQEFRLVSPSAMRRLQYLGGVIYTDTDNFEPYDRTQIFPAEYNRDAFMQSVALYGRTTWWFLPDTAVTTGLRYQHDHQGYDFIFADGTAPESKGTSSYGFVSGDVSLQHEFAQNLKGYVTYTNGQTGKAYDLEDTGDAATPQGLEPLPSEHVYSVEGGLKTQWLDRRLMVNASVFLARYRNYQVQAIQQSNFNINVVPTIRLYAIGKVEDKGVELETRFAATRNLMLDLDATYLDARILSYPNAGCYAGQVQGCVALDPAVPGSPMVQPDLQGPLPGASKYRGTGSVHYILPLPSLPFDGVLGAFYRYQSRVFYDLLGSPVDTQGGFGVLNLTAGIQSRSGGWTVEAFVDNAFNKRYYASLDRDGLSPGFAMSASYDRDSFRYGGVRFTLSF